MEPINYSAQIANPMQAAVQGLQLGSGMQQMQMQQQAQQQALQQQQMRQQSLGELMRNPNPSAQDYVRVASLMPPEQAKQMMTNWETLSKDQQSSQLSFGGQVMAAFQAKQPEIGIDLLKQRAEAAKNSGRQDQAQMYGTWAQLAELNPDAAAKSIGTMIAALPGGDKTLEGLGKLGTEARAQEMQPINMAEGIAKANKEGSLATQEAAKAAVAGELAKLGLDEKRWGIKNLQSEITTRSARLNLDAQTTAATVAEKMASIRDKMTSLPEFAQKEVNTAAVDAATSKQAAAQMNNLASQIEGMGGGWGKFTSANEWAKAQFGGQDVNSALRGEYTRLANSAGIKAYKAAGATGGFSDTDLKTALSGIPPANASPEVMAKFMRGMAKMQDIDASLNNAKTDWLTSNKGQLGRANSGFIAGDFAVKPGETYADFAARVATDVSKRYNPKAQSDLVSQIPTPGSPAPQAGNIRSRADAILAGGR